MREHRARGRRGSRWAALCAAVCAVGSAVGIARPSAAQEEEAQRLFHEGRDALVRGDKEAACAKFRSSLSLARVANTLFNVAQCDERDGKLAAALNGWREGVLLLGAGDERLAAAKERLDALEARVPKVTLAPAADMPAEARILVDGAVIATPAPGVALPLDPGDHAIVVEAPGRAAWRASVTLAERDRKEVAIQAGAVEAPARSSATASAGSAVASAHPPAGSDARRTFGFVAGAIGLGALAGFGVTGGLIVERDGRIREACPSKVCSAAGRELIRGSEPLLVANAALLAVGLAGVGLGTVLVLTSHAKSGGQERRAALAPVVLPGGGGAALTGSF